MIRVKSYNGTRLDTFLFYILIIANKIRKGPQVDESQKMKNPNPEGIECRDIGLPVEFIGPDKKILRA